METDEDFAEYMGSRWHRLVATLVALGCEHHEAEDVAQAGLVRAYRHWSRVRRAGDVDAYVFRTVLNAWSSSRRRRWWGEQPTGELPEGSSSDHASTFANRDEVVRMLGTLPAEQREALVLRYIADLTEEQTAAALGLPVGTVKSRSARALAKLQTMREESR